MKDKAVYQQHLDNLFQDKACTTLKADIQTLSDDYYTLSPNGRTITFHGTNYAGHKFYDAQGNLVWATNARSVALPSHLSPLTSYLPNITIKTAMYNMKDVLCTDQKPDDQGILNVNCEKAHTQAVNLQGQRLQYVHVPGIYIINGKKYCLHSLYP